MEITAEMRAAVYAADCAARGHRFDLTQVLAVADVDPLDPGRPPVPVLAAQDPERLPHIVCIRCQHVWLVIDTEGDDYDDAVTKTAQRMDQPDRFTPKPRRTASAGIRPPGDGTVSGS